MNKRGFTLIEILSAITIIFIIAVIVFTQLNSVNSESKIKLKKVTTANIIRTIDDYIIDNKLKLLLGRPLYFSINALIEEGVFDNKINDELKVFGTGPYFVKTTSDNNKLTHKVVLKSLIRDIVEEQNNLATVGSTGFNETINLIYKNNSEIEFQFKTKNDALFDLIVNKVDYKIYNDSNQLVKENNDVKNVIKNNDDNYAFKFYNDLEIGSYTMKITATSELGAKTTSDPISLQIFPDDQDLLVTTASLSKADWGNAISPNIIVNLSGQRILTKNPAVGFKYTGKKYTDKSKTSYTNISGDILATNGVASMDINTNGIFDLSFQAYDGNGDGTKDVKTVRVDTILPQVNNVTSSANGWSKDFVKLTWSVNDQVSGLSAFEFSYDKTIINPEVTNQPSNQPLSWISDFSWTKDMNETTYFRVKDAAGNLSIWSPGYKIQIDKTKPSCSSSGGSTSWATTRTITGTCSDGMSGCSQSTVTKTISSNTDGSVSPGNVSDNAGNTASCSSQTVKVDTCTPTIGVDLTPYGSTTEMNNMWLNKNAIFKLTTGGGCISPVTVTRKITTGLLSTDGTGEEVYDISDNTYTTNQWSVDRNSNITFVAKAATGRTSTTVSKTLKMDQTPPNSCELTLRKGTTTGAIVNTQTWIDSNVWVIASGSDALSGLNRTEIEFTGATTNRTNCTSSNNVSCTGNIDANGKSYSTPICYDAAGNSKTGSVYDVYVDKQNPSASFGKCGGTKGKVKMVINGGPSPLSVDVRYKFKSTSGLPITGCNITSYESLPVNKLCNDVACSSKPNTLTNLNKGTYYLSFAPEYDASDCFKTGRVSVRTAVKVTSAAGLTTYFSTAADNDYATATEKNSESWWKYFVFSTNPTNDGDAFYDFASNQTEDDGGAVCS